MAETRLEKSFAPAAEIKEEEEETVETIVETEEQQIAALEHEIECPRCRNAMTLCSDFDSLYYFCEGCDFCLYTIKK
jgi:cytochrome c-type biogenesis protein CcmH/NrfF